MKELKNNFLRNILAQIENIDAHTKRIEVQI